MIDITPIASSSAGCCYLVDFGDCKILLDAGAPLKKIRKAAGGDLSGIVACLVSHVHKDHCKYVPEISKRGIPVWSTGEVAEEFYNCVVNILEPNRGLMISDTIHLDIHLMQHDVECVGFELTHFDEIETCDSVLLYATDTGRLDLEIPGLTHLMAEANYSIELLLESTSEHSLDRVFEGHLDIDSVVNFCRRHPDLEEIWLLHLSDRHSDETEFRKRVVDACGVPVYVAEK